MSSQQAKKPSLAVIMITIVLCTILAGGSIILGLPPVLKANNLRSQGATVSGAVTDITLSTGGRGLNRIRFTYNVGGQNYSGVSIVTTKYAKSVRIGDSIPITYLPSDPRIANTPSSTDYNGGMFYLVTGAIVAVLGVIGILYEYRTKR
jgi:hypothetical protein